jgi:hypothetical protein
MEIDGIDSEFLRYIGIAGPFALANLRRTQTPKNSIGSAY